MDMLHFVPLTRELLAIVAADERNPVTAAAMQGEGPAAVLMTRPELAAAMLAGERVLAAAGILPVWHGRALAWALISRHAGRRQVVQAVRAMRRGLDTLQRNAEFRRIEMTMGVGHPYCEAFPRALGMRPEGRMRGWGQDGMDHWLYARVAA